MSNGACELSGSVIDLSTLRADALTELIGILDDEAPTNTSDEEYDGAAPKLISQTCLVLDPLLQGALTLTVTEGPKMFKQHSVKDFVELSWFPLQTECKSVVYLVRPNIQSMKQVRSQKKQQREPSRKQQTAVSMYFERLSSSTTIPSRIECLLNTFV